MKKFAFIFLLFFLALARNVYAEEMDTDQDGLSDNEETNIFRTDKLKKDTDGDGYEDGVEIQNNYDPKKSFDDKIQKVIVVSIRDQLLEYYLGPYQIGQFKISSGKKGYDTPRGDFEILVKKPAVNYRGRDYNYPNTKWNLLFKFNSKGNYYIHGAYWHDNFGQVMSHGCVNAPYSEMEKLYNWAEKGTKLEIK